MMVLQNPSHTPDRWTPTPRWTACRPGSATAPNALATMARRPKALGAVLSLAEQVIFEPGASAVGLRWMAAYATCVGAGCGYSGTHAAHGAVDAGEALPARRDRGLRARGRRLRTRRADFA